MTSVSSVCDVCHNSRRKTLPYELRQDGDRVIVDLCREHGAPVERLIKLGRPLVSTSPRVKVWDMAEIEAKKKGRK